MTCKKTQIKKKSRLKQSGQFMLEAVLLMVLFLGIATAMKKSFKDKNILAMMVADPWKNIAGMMSNGVWKKEGDGYVLHPQGNVMSREGDNK